jgi:hypothetical protein
VPKTLDLTADTQPPYRQRTSPTSERTDRPARSVSIIGIVALLRFGTGMSAYAIRTRFIKGFVNARWARHHLEELVSSPIVRIDLVDCAAGPRDRYGRGCGILYADGRDVAPTMIREGLAHPYVCEAGHCPQRQPWCTRCPSRRHLPSLRTQEYLKVTPIDAAQ